MESALRSERGRVSGGVADVPVAKNSPGDVDIGVVPSPLPYEKPTFPPPVTFPTPQPGAEIGSHQCENTRGPVGPIRTHSGARSFT